MAPKTPQPGSAAGVGWTKILVPVFLLGVLRAVVASCGVGERVDSWFRSPRPTSRPASSRPLAAHPPDEGATVPAAASLAAEKSAVRLPNPSVSPDSLADSLAEQVRQSLARSRATARRAEEAAASSYSEGTTRKLSERRLPMTPLPTPTLRSRPLLSVAPPETLLPIAAEVTALTPLPDSIGNIYFLGHYRNSGEATISQPRVELTLWSADHKALATATGFTVRRSLEKGEVTPLKILVQHAPAYATVTTRIDPQRERYAHPRPTLELSAGVFARDHYLGYRVTGTVKNPGATTAQYVQIIAVLYDEQDHIVGMDSRFLQNTHLPAGQSADFAVDVTLVRGRPTRTQLDYQATELSPRR